MVKFDNISFSYGNKNDEQLKNISFEINRGEFVLICGRSACGKTTVTKCINGLIPHFSEDTGILQLPACSVQTE